MDTEHFKVMNVKCAGCATNIKQGLTELSGISIVEVGIDTGEVTVEGERLDRQQLAEKLSGLGYPEA